MYKYLLNSREAIDECNCVPSMLANSLVEKKSRVIENNTKAGTAFRGGPTITVD